MSDSDDQDRTRIQLRGEPLAPFAARSAARRQCAALFSAHNSSSESPADALSDGGVKSMRPASRPIPRRNRERTLSFSSRGSQGSEDASGTLQVHHILKKRFILERVLGAGGMGVVFKARDLLKVEARDRDPYVAIKVLRDEFKSHPEAFIALQRESRKTQRIAHPNIVNVYDFDKDRRTVFMTMEFLEGTPLDQLIKKYRTVGLPHRIVWPILGGVCSALAYAHHKKIIHSDLKPGNIFVTRQTVAKVFDFGIARAVARAEQIEGGEVSGDRTVFDAGILGALTPAYASLEMLEGRSPDVRDDIYALGCIAYELFTGVHPFRRRTAKEAKRSGLKPARIRGISKHQWRTIESALAFDRASRSATVKEFWSQLTKKQARPNQAWPMVLALTTACAWLGFQYYIDINEQKAMWLVESDYRDELEAKIRLEFKQQSINELLATPVFDDHWENLLWDHVQELTRMAPENQKVLTTIVSQVAQLYLHQVEKDVHDNQLAMAKKHIVNGLRYISETSVEADALEHWRVQVNKAIAAGDPQLGQQESPSQTFEVQGESKQKAKLRHQHKQERHELSSIVALLNKQLQCNSLPSMKKIASAVRQVRALDSGYAQNNEFKMVEDLAVCIQKLSHDFPDWAREAHRAARVLFPDHAVLHNMQFNVGDSCSASLAGLGARGYRSLCQDRLSSGGKGPVLIVVPPKGDIKEFALGKYETRVSDINEYCRVSLACDPIDGASRLLPATGLSSEFVETYLQWLSRESGRKYRLPTLTEWAHGVWAGGGGLDSNRNCKLDSPDIQKSGALVNATIGQQNGWGLVNALGNAKEWVWGQDALLLAVGGSYGTDMEDCTLGLQEKSSGRADPEVGFRVLRELGQ